MRLSIQSMALGFSVTSFVFLGSLVQASNPDLINEALNQNLQEREQVTGTYLQNPEASRPGVAGNERDSDSRIPVVMDGELTSGSRPLRNFDRSDRLFHEKRIEARLDQEVKSVDRAFNRETPVEVSGAAAELKNGG